MHQFLCHRPRSTTAIPCHLHHQRLHHHTTTTTSAIGKLPSLQFHHHHHHHHHHRISTTVVASMLTFLVLLPPPPPLPPPHPQQHQMVSAFQPSNQAKLRAHFSVIDSYLCTLRIWDLFFNLGPRALIFRIGFGVYSIIIKIRSRQNPILIIKAPRSYNKDPPQKKKKKKKELF